MKAECVQWNGALTSEGYGQIRISGRVRLAHRLMWELFNGQIQPGLQIDHLCRNRACQNVAHMEMVTSRVNTLRGTGPSAANSHKATCPRGHEYDLVEVVGRRKDGTPRYGRGCRQCKVLRTKEWRARARTRKFLDGEP